MENLVFEFAHGLGYFGLAGAAFMVGFLAGALTAVLVCESVVKEKKFWNEIKPNTFGGKR